jgi:crossover junction endodeoxyribonuclease RusA
MRVFLPYPPSANKLRRISFDGQFRSTKVYRDWMAEAQWIVALAVRDGRGIGYGKLPGTYRLDAVAMPPKANRSRDLDNLLKATCDALKRGGAIEDDSLCQEISLRWGELDGPGILVEVQPCANQLSPVDGKGKPTSATAKSPTRRRTHRGATIRDARTGEYMDMGAWAWLGLGDRPSSTPAESTSSKKPKT